MAPITHVERLHRETGDGRRTLSVDEWRYLVSGKDNRDLVFSSRFLRSTAPELRLSILDHTPVSSGSTLGEAFWQSTSLAELAEQVGYERYWVAEHHNMPWLASSSPAVLVAHVAAEPRACASAPLA
jgi:hypothetical protein